MRRVSHTCNTENESIWRVLCIVIFMSLFILEFLCSVSFQGIRIYSKCSKFFNIFFFLFSNKMTVTRAGIHELLVKIENREYYNQTASEAV